MALPLGPAAGQMRDIAFEPVTPKWSDPGEHGIDLSGNVEAVVGRWAIFDPRLNPVPQSKRI
ncbi:MAG: hypothetical protein AAFR44_04710, partial [Pseudomonadota bacterium]